MPLRAPLLPASASLLLALAPPAQDAEAPPVRAPVAHYSLRAELLPAERQLRGEATIRWRNAAGAATGEILLHLYLNAFAGERTTFLREAGREFRSQWRAGDFGGIDVGEVTDGDGNALATGFVQPDDGNADDRTVLRVELRQPVPPGGETTLRLPFTSRLPKALRRSGWTPGGGFFCMHWYPILGVLQDDGQGGVAWNCHQFHANSEFFADFASFAVELVMPQQLVVGATGGEPQAVEDLGDGRLRRVWSIGAAAPVHNFAFVADAAFQRAVRTFGPSPASDDRTGMAARVATLLGEGAEAADLPAVQMVLLLQPEHDVDAIRERCFSALRVGLEFYGRRFGAYPYPTITAVDPGRDVEGRLLGGGMEYPMLITLGTDPFPHRQQLAPEGVTVHEFGHQFWYGLAANNEFEEAWLDEGINTFSQGRAQLLGYGEEPRLVGGRAMTPRSVTDFGLLPIAASRGPFAPPDGLRPRPDLPGLWRLPWRRDLERLHFDGRWLPASPLLELLRCQPQVAWFPAVATQRCWRDRDRFLAAATPDPMVLPGWQYVDEKSYRVNSYTRPATVLRELERLVEAREPGRFWAFLREFHQRWRFRHPTTADFAALLQDRCGAAIAEYFRAAIAAGATLDYGLAGAPEQIGDRTVVRVARYGALTADVVVRFTFERGDGPEYRRIARDDLAALHRFEFVDDPAKPRGQLLEVWIDPPELAPGFEEPAWPCGLHLLDQDLTNNAWRRRSEPVPAQQRALRALLQAQCELSFAGILG